MKLKTAQNAKEEENKNKNKKNSTTTNPNTLRRTFFDDDKYQLQSNDAVYNHLNAENFTSERLNTVPHGDQIKSLRGKGQG